MPEISRLLYNREPLPFSIRFLEVLRFIAMIIGAITLAFGAFTSHAGVTVELSADATATKAAASAPSEIRFAKDQIRHFETLLGNLSERADNEADTNERGKLKDALSRLEDRIDQAKKTLETYAVGRGPAKPFGASSGGAFVLEDLRGSLFAMQDAGSRAISRVMAADNRREAREREVAGF